MPDKTTTDSSSLLDKAENYPRWVLNTIGLLKENNCDEIISGSTPINQESAKKELRDHGFSEQDLSPAALIKTVQDQLKTRKDRESRATGIILRQVAERHRSLIASKGAKEMWTILETRFKDLSPMSALDIIAKISKKYMADFSDASDYCSAFESALDKVSGMISEKSLVNAKAAESMIQVLMLNNVNESYAPIIAQLRRDWKEGEVDLSATSRIIVTYAGSMKEKAKTLYTSPSSQKRKRPGYTGEPCNHPVCVKEGRFRGHGEAKCWEYHPEQRPTRPSKSIKTTTTKTESEGAKPPTVIDS